MSIVVILVLVALPFTFVGLACLVLTVRADRKDLPVIADALARCFTAWRRGVCSELANVDHAEPTARSPVTNDQGQNRN